MLQRMSSEVRECLAKAAEARRKGDQTFDKEIKGFGREMEDRWIGLARSYEHVHRTDDFLENAVHGAPEKRKVGPDGASPAKPVSFLRHEGAEFLRLAQECEEPDVEHDLRMIGAELLNEANRAAEPVEQPARKKRDEA